MKVALQLYIVLSISVIAFAQARQERESASQPTLTEPQIVDLPLNREGQPLVLFKQAARDKKGRCNVHHRALTVAVVPIDYGLLPSHSAEYYETERREFPNAITRYEGGCVVMNAKQAKVLQCHKCLAARKRALAAYPKRVGTS